MGSHWCAVCGGAPDRKIVDGLDGGLPRCEVCAADNRDLQDWNPRTRRRGPRRPDGNAMNAKRDPDAWAEWCRISESWGMP